MHLCLRMNKCETKIYGAMTKWLERWIPNPMVLGSKSLSGSKVDSAYHPFKVHEPSAGVELSARSQKLLERFSDLTAGKYQELLAPEEAFCFTEPIKLTQ